MRCSWNATSHKLACQNEATVLIGDYALCPDHAPTRDAFTMRHLDTWLDANINGDTCRAEVKGAMLTIYDDDPEYWSGQAWSNLYDRAKGWDIERRYR